MSEEGREDVECDTDDLALGKIRMSFEVDNYQEKMSSDINVSATRSTHVCHSCWPTSQYDYA